MKRAIKIELENRGNNNFSCVKDAVEMANYLLMTDKFYEEIASHNSFDYANISPVVIAGIIQESNFKMSLDLYYSLSPVRSIDGYDDIENPNIIHINIWRTDRSPESICNTMIHACVHAVNACNRNYYFGHGDNTLAGKENTAPYWIGALAQRMLSKDEPIIIPLEHDIFAPRINSIKRQQYSTSFIVAQ